MPWGKMSQSVRAHAHHIISDLLRKKIHQFLTAGVTGGKKQNKKLNSFILSGCCCCVREGNYLVIGAVLPSGQNTP